jgi:multidrug efflux pump subunit AcrB
MQFGRPGRAAVLISLFVARLITPMLAGPISCASTAIAEEREGFIMRA